MSSADTDLPALVDEEVRTDVLDYFPVITNKKIYYQLLTQHINYYDHDAQQQRQPFQDDTFSLNESSVEWRVPLTVQKRLDMMNTDWNKPPSTLHEIPNILYLQDLSLFIDASTKLSRLLYRAKIDSSAWHWQEKSKCFPLIETTEKHLVFSHPQHERQAYAADKTRKATYSHRSVRKLALFDATARESSINVPYNNPTPPDYGKEVATSTATTPPMQAATAAETTSYGKSQNNQVFFYRPPGSSFHPHQEIDDFIKQKKQVMSRNMLKQKHHHYY